MQKKLIALAVAALASTGAMAQVSFYGVLDAGVVSATGKQAGGSDQKFAGIAGGNLSGNRLGFTAEEDLGDGLKALGRFELNLAIDATTGSGTGTKAGEEGNGITQTRQSYVGLSSGAGTLTLGRQYAPGFGAGIKHDALGGSGLFGPFGTLANSVAMSQSITNGGGVARANNAVAYTSPKLGGSTVVKAAVARVTSELSTAAANGDLASLGVEFSQGPLDVSAVVAQIDEFSATADHSEMMIGVNYNLGVAKLMAMYISTERDNTTGADPKGKFFQIGAVVPVGKGNVKVALGTADTDATGTDAAKTFAIDYEHALGKRTTAYVGVNNTKVGSFATVKVGGVAASADESITAVAAGVRLTF